MDSFLILHIWNKPANIVTSLQFPATREPEISQRNAAHYGLMGVDGESLIKCGFFSLVLASGFSAKDLGDLGFDEGACCCV